MSSTNGVCEDGGPNSLSISCALGTDCDDCGPRVATFGQPDAETRARAEEYLCSAEAGGCIDAVVERLCHSSKYF